MLADLTTATTSGSGITTTCLPSINLLGTHAHPISHEHVYVSCIALSACQCTFQACCLQLLAVQVLRHTKSKPPKRQTHDCPLLHYPSHHFKKCAPSPLHSILILHSCIAALPHYAFFSVSSASYAHTTAGPAAHAAHHPPHTLAAAQR